MIIKLVQSVLTQVPDTRNSDHVLYYFICGVILSIQGIDIGKTDFGGMFLAPNEYGLPQFETVSRARRKLQHDLPELSGSVKVSMQRSMSEDAFRELATE